MTFAEIFTQGEEAFKAEDYINAEKWFLKVLFEYSKLHNSSDGYMQVLTSLDRLSMNLYQDERMPDKARAVKFFKILGHNKDVAYPYAGALVNGVFGAPDYPEAIRYLSKAMMHDQEYLISYMYLNGYGLEKDETKAAHLLGDLYHHDRRRAEELLKTLKGDFSLQMDVLAAHERAEEILKELFATLIDEPGDDNNKSLELLLRDFFNDKTVIPDLDLIAYEPETNLSKGSNPKNDFVFQRRALERLFDDASLAPIFRMNKKYFSEKYKDMVPYIAYDDVMGRKYIIRWRPNDVTNSFHNEKGEIIAEYKSIEEIVKDGWELD